MDEITEHDYNYAVSYCYVYANSKDYESQQLFIKYSKIVEEYEKQQEMKNDNNLLL